MKLKPGTVLTLVSLTITLFLIGFYLLIFAHLSKLEDIVNEKTPFVIELMDSLSQPEIFLLQQNIKSRPYVMESGFEFIPGDEGLEMLEEQFGKQILSDSSKNPLMDVIRFHLKSNFIKENKVDKLIGEFNAMPEVSVSYFEQQHVTSLKATLRNLNRILLFTGLLFIAISILLIYNNLKLVLRNDRFMLKTMELIGASPSFIKLPYIRKSIQIGFTAGLINIILFLGIFIYLNQKVQVFEHFFDFSITAFILILLLFIGILFPLVFSNYLVNKYIKIPVEKRYE